MQIAPEREHPRHEIGPSTPVYYILISVRFLPIQLTLFE